MENKRIINIVQYAFPISLAVIVFVLNIWKTNRGFIMHDDAWYAYLLRDMPANGMSQFHMLWQNVFDGQIWAMKLGVLICDVVGAFVLSCGIFRFVRKENVQLCKWDSTVLFSLIFIAVSLFSVLLTVPSYVTMNRCIVQIAIGCLLCGYTFDNIWAKVGLSTLSGFALALLTFIMITNLALVPVVWLLFICLEHNKCGRWSVGLAMIGGAVLALAYYFICIESFTDYWANFMGSFEVAVTGSEDIGNHGLKAMILWVYNTIFDYYISTIFVAVLALFGLRYIYTKYDNKWARWTIIALVAAFVFYYFRMDIWRKGYSVSAVTPFYVLYAYLYVVRFRDMSMSMRWIAALLFFVPFFLSLGTDQTLAFRSHEYMGFLLPMLYVWIRENKKQLLVVGLLISLYFVTSIAKLDKNNWGWLVYTEQTCQVQDLGLSQNVYVTQEQYKGLDELNDYIQPTDKVIVSNPLLWGYAYLLDTKPLVYDYRQPVKMLVSAAENLDDVTQVKIIEGKWYPFEEEVLLSLRDALHKDSICSQEISVGKVYWFE